MYQAQQALISHLQNAVNANEDKGKVSGEDAAKEVAEYSGQIQKGLAGQIKLPCILVLYVNGNPMAELPEFHFELLFGVDTQQLDKEVGKKAALKFCQAYAQFLKHNQRFEDDARYYTLTGPGTQKLEDMQMETILNDFKYTLLSLPLVVQVGS